MAKSTFKFPFPRAMFVTCGIIPKAVQDLDWEKAFENLSVEKKANLLNETLQNIFINYIPNKKIKSNYCQSPWINDNIKRCLKERPKLTKIFCKNGQKREDREKLEAKATYWTEQIVKANYES